MDNEKVIAELAELKQRMTDTDRRLKNVEDTIKRIESLTISVERLASSVEKLAEDQAGFRADQKELADRLTDVERIPDQEKAGKYKVIVEKAVGLILAGVIGFLLSHFFGI